MRSIPLLLLALVACSVKASVVISSKATDAGHPAELGELQLDNSFELSQPGPRAQRLPRRVLIVGDSEACAVGAYVQAEVRKLNEAAGDPLDTVHVDCRGATVISYWGSYGNLRRALHEFRDPDAVLIFLGTNHYWNRSTPDVSDVVNVLDDEAAWYGSMPCVWVGPTAVQGKQWPVNALLRDAVSLRCEYFDTEAAGIPLHDGVHPTADGAVKWVRLVWPMVPPKLSESSP